MNQEEINNTFSLEQKREQRIALRKKIITIVHTVLTAILILISMGIIMATAMANDSVGKNVLVWTVSVVLSIALPFTRLISIIVSWICYLKKAFITWRIFLLLPRINLMLLILLLVVLFN